MLRHVHQDRHTGWLVAVGVLVLVGSRGLVTELRDQQLEWGQSSHRPGEHRRSARAMHAAPLRVACALLAKYASRDA